MTTTKIEVEQPTATLRECVSQIAITNPSTRDGAASIVRHFGFKVHIGGRHVAILCDGLRVAIITGSTPDWN